TARILASCQSDGSKYIAWPDSAKDSYQSTATRWRPSMSNGGCSTTPSTLTVSTLQSAFRRMRSELLLGAGPRVPIDPPGVGSPPGASGPTCVLITGVLMSAVPGAERQRTGIESPQLRKWGSSPHGVQLPAAPQSFSRPAGR